MAKLLNEGRRATTRTHRLHSIGLRAGASIAFFIASSAAGAAGFSMVQDHQAKGVIVTSDAAGKAAQEAATSLQQVVQRMTGASLAMVKASEYDGKMPPIFVGPSDLVRKQGIDIPQDREAYDRYVIQCDDKCLILAGNDAGELRGSPYAVFDLLQRLGCGWFGPDPAWQVIPKRASLTVPALNVDERPAFLLRDNWVLSRLDPELRAAWRLGGYRVSHGHAFERYLPRAKYITDHPDYFGGNQKQPCLTHPDVIQIIVKQMREELDRKEGIVSFSLSANDNKQYCECDRCKAVGDISARMMNLANTIARELAKTHPNRYLLTFYAYWMAHDAPNPVIKAEPHVCVMMVNEGNHMRPWDAPEPASIRQLDRNDNNYREVTAFEGWRKTGAILGIYEWWIPTVKKPVWKSIPWYSGETALRNLRYWKRAGVRYITYQTGEEAGNGFPIRWPLYYVGARGLWNPDLTCEQIMSEACDKLYGPAAKPMLRFYTTIEKAMMDTAPSLRGYAWRLPGPEDIYSPPTEAQATAALEQAAASAADDAARERIRQEREMWTRARTLMDQERHKNQPATQPADKSYN